MATVTMEPPRRRRADDATVRKMQFDTARRILFGTDLIPGTDRPMWTSAGFIRPDNVQYNTPFPLGPFTFVLRRVPRSQNGILVFIEMRNVVHPFPDGTMENLSTDLIIRGNWVAIGVLRQDEFFPIIPNFLNTTAVRVFAENEEEYLSTLNGEMSILSIDNGKVMAGIIFNISGDFAEDFDDPYDSERESEYYISHETEFHVFQMAADGNGLGSLGTRLATVEENEPVIFQVFLVGKTTTDVGTVVEKHFEITSWNDFNYEIQFEIPFKYLQSFFNVDIPNDFTQSMVENEQFDPNKLCVFTTSVSGRGRGRVISQETTVWKASDMLAVAYAQSWIVHVLGGPDRRMFRPDPNNLLPMKETREPDPLFRFRLDKERDVYCYEMLGAYPGGSTDFISFRGRVRFFQESLTTKASKALLENLGVGTPLFPERLNVVATANRNVFFMITNAIENIQRFKKQEFLGQRCHVCFKNEAKFHVKDTGIKICSKICHNILKN